MTDNESFKQVNQWFNKLVDESEENKLQQLKNLEATKELSNEQLQLLTQMLVADSDEKEALPEVLSDMSQNWQDDEASVHLKELPKVGTYRLLELIGSGGMGHVYLAARDDGSYEQQVAIKISQFHFNQSLVKRFENERQILAQLTHPNIAQLLDGGTAANDQPYLVMEHIKGFSIDAYCIKHQLGLRDRLGLIIQTCEAVSFAHQNLVLHRDLKPANIMVNDAGQVKLLDFGIAKLLSEDLDQSQQTMTQIMTKNYASPEQIKGVPVSTQSDLFSLAIITYELVSGFHPYIRKNEIERDQNVLTGKIKPITTRSNDSDAVFPELSSIASDRLKGDIENILLKALSPEAENRYASVEAFAQDIIHFLENKPIKARKPTFLYTLKKLIQRQKALFVTITVLTTCLILLTLYSFDKANDAEVQKNLAQMESEQSNQMVDFLSSVFTSAKPQSGQQELSARDLLIQGLENITTEINEAPSQKFELMSVMIESLESLSYFESVFSYVDAFHPRCVDLLSAQNENCQKLLISAGESANSIQQDEKALSYLKTAEKNARIRPVNQALLAEILRVQFNAYINLNQYDAAVKATDEALDYYQSRANQTKEIINIYSDLAVLATHKSRFEEAKSHYDSMRPLVENMDVDDIDLMTRYYANLSFFYIKQKLFDEAIIQRQKSIDLLKSHFERPSFSLAWDQESLAKTYFFSGDIKSAIHEAYEALATFEALNSEADKHIYLLKLFMAQMLVLNDETEKANEILSVVGDNSWDKRCLYELVDALTDVYGSQLTRVDYSLTAYESCLKTSTYPTKFANEFNQLLKAEVHFIKKENTEAREILKQLDAYWNTNPRESLPVQHKAKNLKQKIENS